MKAEHYYTKRPTSAERRGIVILNVGGRYFEFLTSSGVFSPRQVDKATQLLIGNMVLKPGGEILDMGAGYGPIGIVAAALDPKAKVTMVEINERAANLAKKNIASNGLRNAKAIAGDFFEPFGDKKFDNIVMNPPIAIGLKKNFEVLEQCKEHLKPGGSLQIVARHNKGGSRFKEKMKEVFGNVEDLVKSGGFRVYMSILK